MPTKYVLCDTNCKYEALDKEETLSAIQQAIENGGVVVDPTEPFVTQIKDQNTGLALKVWVGTEAQFAALETKEDGTLYIYSTDFETNVNALLEAIINGAQTVGNAEFANDGYASGVKYRTLWSNAEGLLLAENTDSEEDLTYTIETDVDLRGKRLELELCAGTHSSTSFRRFVTFRATDTNFSHTIFQEVNFSVLSDGVAVRNLSAVLGTENPKHLILYPRSRGYGGAVGAPDIRLFAVRLIAEG